MEIVFLMIGMVAGMLMGYMISKNQKSGLSSEIISQKNLAEQRFSDAANRIEQLQNELKLQREQNVLLSNEATQARTEKQNLQQRLDNQKQELEELQNRFTREFENLANRIFEEKGKKFADQNQSNLNLILNPFQQKIVEFQQQVKQAYETELKDKTSLRQELKNLAELNKKISEEAGNLTKALKGDTKKQGNWGETILEKVLEQSGLTKGVEYETQFTTTNVEGETIRPDVIVNLPDNKHIIIDAKVSLIAYEKFVNSENETDRKKFLDEHLISVRNHIKLLSSKDYYTGKNLRTPDFVLLFIPIESSFAVALQNDNQLYNYAWDKKIVMVSPTTLLATLMTVSSLWKIENQNKNHVEIARLAGEMYDKLVGFTTDMIAIGNKLNGAKENYDEAMKKFSEGSGNAIKTAEKIKALGAKTSKNFNQALTDRSVE